MNWFLDAVKNKYAAFGGRARREEFWMYVLFFYIFAFAILIVDGILYAVTGFAGLYVLYVLGVFVPTLAVAIRRLHDTNRSGWWLLISFVPCISLILIYFYVLDSQPGANEWGPNPKGVMA